MPLFQTLREPPGGMTIAFLLLGESGIGPIIKAKKFSREEAIDSDHCTCKPANHGGITGASQPSMAPLAGHLGDDLLAPVLLLALAEVALRVCGVGTPTGVTRPCTDQGRPAYCDNPSFAAILFPGRHVPDTAAVRDSREKAPGTYRIFVLGESVAWGDPDPTYGFARYLEMMLRERYPLAKFEVINTSITALNSHAFLPMVEDLVHYQPDLFVIYAGNTEVVGPFGPGTVLTPWDLSLPAIRARIFLNSTRLGQLVGKFSRTSQKNEWRGMEMFLDRQVRADSPQMKPVYENFAANLRDIVAVARRAGAQVLISTVATNLKDCAPFASLHRKGLREDELHSWEGLVQRGADLDKRGIVPRGPEAIPLGGRYRSSVR